MPFEYVYNNPEVEIEVLTTNGDWNPADFVFSLVENTGILKSGTLLLKTATDNSNIIASVVNIAKNSSALVEVCNTGTVLSNDLLSTLPAGDLTTSNFGTAIRSTNTSLFVGDFEALRATSSGVRVGIASGNPVSSLHVYENSSASGSSAGITIEQTGSGDASLHFIKTATWTVGVDGSDTAKFKIASSDTLGSSTALSLSTSNNLGIGTDSVLTFNASSTLFASSSPKLEVVTGSGSTAYKEGLVLRHLDTGTSGSLFLAFKHKDESSAANSNIMTGLESKVSGSSLTLNLIAEGTTGIVLSSGAVILKSDFSTDSSVDATFNGAVYFSGTTTLVSGSSLVVSGTSSFSGDTAVQDLTVNGDATFPNGFTVSGSIDATTYMINPNDFGFKFATTPDTNAPGSDPQNPTSVLVENIRRNNLEMFGAYSPESLSGLFVRLAPESGTSRLSGSVGIIAQSIYDSNLETAFAGGDYPSYKAINFLSKSPNAPSRAPLGTQSPIYSYGLYIEEQKTGVVSGGWGVYQAGLNDENYFAGDTTFTSDVTLSNDLIMSGNLYTSGNHYWDANSFQYLTAFADNQGWTLDLLEQDAYSGGYWQIRSDSSVGSSTSIFTVRGDTLRVGIKNTNPQYTLDVSGSVSFSTSDSSNTLLLNNNTGNQNGWVPVFTVQRTPTGSNPIAGFGSESTVLLANNAKETVTGSSVVTRMSSVVDGSEGSAVDFYTLHNGDMFKGLSLESGTLQGFSSLVLNKPSAPVLSYSGSTGTTTSYFVQAIDAEGYGIVTSSAYTTTGDVIQVGTTFTWTEVPGAKNYHLWFASNSNVSSLEHGELYYRVQAAPTATSWTYLGDFSPYARQEVYRNDGVVLQSNALVTDRILTDLSSNIVYQTIELTTSTFSGNTSFFPTGGQTFDDNPDDYVTYISTSSVPLYIEKSPFLRVIKVEAFGEAEISADFSLRNAIKLVVEDLSDFGQTYEYFSLERHTKNQIHNVFYFAIPSSLTATGKIKVHAELRGNLAFSGSVQLKRLLLIAQKL